MGIPTGLTDLEARIEEQFGLKRSLLFAVGLGCLGVGGLSALLPVGFYESLIRVIGVLAIGSGGIKAGQLLIGRQSPKALVRSWYLILGQVGLDLATGFLLLNHRRGSVEVVTALFGLLFVFEGGLMLYAAVRSPTRTSLALLVLGGGLAGALGVAVLLRLVPDPLRWAGVFVGLKLMTFGGTLVWIAWNTPRGDQALLYESAEPLPRVGEAYAVYFGSAFHLGIYIGHGEVVHYLNDNFVYRVSWATFLDGRSPEHWTYPDLEPVEPGVVVETALGEVGKTYPYHLLTFNCENFAIFCKTGGRTRSSKYAQVAGGVANLGRHPILGMVAETNTRLVEWLAFHFGGPSGKHLSLVIRRIGAMMTNWLVGRAR